MYCPSCGAELTSDLIYCNRCGANLRSQSNQSDNSAKMVGMTWAISTAVVLVTLAGFGLIFALAMTLISRGINLSGGGMILIVIFLLIILAIAWLLIRQLSRVLDISELVSGAPPAKTTGQSALSEKPIQQISAPRERVLSVTDHTTRTFEPIHNERDTKR
jgi:Na+-transporting methylmalonyl-CoA/oxaloacetate decarboxylase gamma subunit